MIHAVETNRMPPEETECHIPVNLLPIFGTRQVTERTKREISCPECKASPNLKYHARFRYLCVELS